MRLPCSVTPKIDCSVFERFGITVEVTGEVSPSEGQYLDFKTTHVYPPEFISNYKMMQTDSIYTDKIDNKYVKVEMRNLSFEFNNYYLNFQCHQSNQLGENAFLEFEKLKSSIKLL
ncbi:hypothetical protein [Flavobacterium sp.]|uniref:hypothetical protein n=1 Tax=Flavobacterium sp. TaxID=239 RepID=UPI004048509C